MSAGMTPGEITRRPARVVIADDEALFRASLRQLLAVPPRVLNDVYGVDVGTGFDVVGEAGSGAETVQIVRSVNPDLLLLDLQMPRMTGLDALCDLAARHATPPTILLAGAIEGPHLLNAVRLGVHGFVLKEFTAELLFEAIMCVLAGQYWLGPTLVTDFMESVRPLIQPAPVAVPGGAALTRREREVIARVVSGCANKEIAREFSVSEETVKHHLTRIFAKVGAANRVELAMLARTYGLVDATDPLPEAQNATIAESEAAARCQHQ
jgi:two-component system, NarL family, nitrate/nitrite response regulator NarL